MKKQEPFYYEARLPEVGAEIAIQFFPDCNMMNIRFIKDGKKHVLSMMNYDPENSSFCEIDNKTNVLKFYKLVYDEEIGPCEVSREFVNEKGEILHEEN